MLRHQLTYKTALSLLAGFLSLAITHSAMSAPPAQDPLFLKQPVRPLMMLNMSNDHQLFFKLYADYEDLDDPKDGVPNTTYTHGYDYYGYFDSGKCYTYSTSNSRFEPSRVADGSGYCNTGGASNEWNGNFLNWATMTRIDAVRKILYGGKRSTDTATDTVLERSFLPHDAHAFAKFYDGADVSKLTPFSDNGSDSQVEDRGVTICNTTASTGSNELSQNVDDPPLLRIAQGNFSLWASNERWQCVWGDGSNGNVAATTGIDAHSSSPVKANDKLGEGDYNVRVQVCKAGLIGVDNSENCQAYGSSQKPTGLLQEYGEKGSILFGLMTGSYDKNKSGGVLRKTIGDMTDEIDLTDGTFKVPSAAEASTFTGIISTLDKLRIYGYRYQNGTYFGTTGSDDCGFQLSSFNDGKCRNWGNPQSEIYLESLRYLGNKGVNSAFNSDDSDRIPGLNTAIWDTPVTNDNYCAPLSVIQFNASTSSYDGDDLAKASDLDFTSPASLDLATDAVGINEGLNTGTYFFGKLTGSATNSDGYELCTAKSISGLSDVRGTCPDAPRLEGSYQIAGMAYHARKNGIPITGVSKIARQTVRTYGVALAPAVPSVTVPVPGGSDKTVTIQPACRNTNPHPDGNCALVDFKIVEQESTSIDIAGFATPVRKGKLYVNWEDSEQGGDFDQDMWGVIDYVVSANNVVISTNAIQESTSGIMGFGYVISGTTSDGFHVHSGIEGFTHTPISAPLGASIQGCGDASGDSCQVGDSATTNTYVIGSSTAEPLQQPLYYAAKWGGYADDAATPAEIAASDPKSYYSATDPRTLEKELGEMLERVRASVGSAASVATNSTRLTEGAFVYQARFDSTDWTGELLAFEIDSNNNISTSALVTTDDTMLTSGNASARQVFTYNPLTDSRVDFTWSALTADQKTALIDGDDATMGERRLNWIRGENTYEGAVGGFRERKSTENEIRRLLGDIVNSSPVYLGGRDRGYGQLPAAAGGGAAYATFLDAKRAKQPALFVGANDGMLHIFDAETLQERAAYVPNGVYGKLARLSDPNYGRADVPHHYTVDGPLAIGDAYIGNEWKSVIVGTLGAGGKSVFALDVTEPDNPKVLFDLDSADFGNQLGYVLGKPIIARMANGRWAAVFGNGYDSGHSKLFVVDLESPKPSDGYTQIIDTEAGSGLSAVELLGDATGQVIYAYAGDLNGNMWKFDLTSTSAAGWKVAYSGDALFTAKDGEGNVQPITGAPTLGFNEQRGGALNVYFGTGKYFDHADNTQEAGDPKYHSFYAIADEGPVTGTRDTIFFQKDLSDSAGTRNVLDDDKMDWSDTTYKGWVIDFNTRIGEQVTTKPLLLYDQLIFPTLIPSVVPCEYGGQSWLMGVIAVGDKFVDEGLIIKPVPSESLILSSPSYGVVDEDTGKLIISYSSGELREEDPPLPDGALGRQSWRQLR